MEVKIYKALSRYYHYDWEDFALRYIDLISAYLAQNRIDKAEILDLACGSGILAYELAILGHTVTGLDQSLEMLERAEHKCRNLPKVDFIAGDMAKFDLNRQFDLITCTYDSINYLTEQSQLESYFQSVGKHLEQDGLFIFDSNTEAGYKLIGRRELVHEFDNEKVVHLSSFDESTGLSGIKFEFEDGSTEIHVQRPYGEDDLLPYFEMNSLKRLHTFGGFKREVYDRTSPRMICIVRKI